MRALFGIAVMQRVIASPMQAARSSAVGLLTLASAAVESTLASKPSTPNIVVRILIMTISLGRALALRHGTDDGCLCSPRPGTGCDGDHTNSFFVLSAVIAAYGGFGRWRSRAALVAGLHTSSRPLEIECAAIAWRKVHARLACGPS
jgi:hypothetical protein